MILSTDENNFTTAFFYANKYDSGSNLSARIAAGEDVKLKLVAVLQLEALTRPLLPQAAPVSLFVCLFVQSLGYFCLSF